MFDSYRDLFLSIYNYLFWNSVFSKVGSTAKIDMKYKAVVFILNWVSKVLFNSSSLTSSLDHVNRHGWRSLEWTLTSFITQEKKEIRLSRSGFGISNIRRNGQCYKLFDSVVSNTAHKLHHLLPLKNIGKYNFRNKRSFTLPQIRTNRYTIRKSILENPY